MLVHLVLVCYRRSAGIGSGFCHANTVLMSVRCSFFFFFQAEDGIRDTSVTGVQTCALPIWTHHESPTKGTRRGSLSPSETSTSWPRDRQLASAVVRPRTAAAVERAFGQR